MKELREDVKTLINLVRQGETKKAKGFLDAFNGSYAARIFNVARIQLQQANRGLLPLLLGLWNK